MKHPTQLQAEHNAQSLKVEARYTEVRDAVGKTLQRIMAMRSAIMSLELKLETAVVEFETELKTIEENYSNRSQ